MVIELIDILVKNGAATARGQQFIDTNKHYLKLVNSYTGHGQPMDLAHIYSAIHKFTKSPAYFAADLDKLLAEQDDMFKVVQL